MHLCKSTLVAVVAALGGLKAQAALSGNLIGGGDFEDVGTMTFAADSGQTVSDMKYFKHEHSPRTLAEINAGANPVRAWQFHPDFDLGRWMTVYGNGSANYDLQKGISTYNDPRAQWDGVNNQWLAPVSEHNISVDPSNPSNHVMESVKFRSSLGIFVQAPSNQVAGPAQLDFDYFVYDWTRSSAYYNYQAWQVPVILHMWVYGVAEEGQPSWEDRWGRGRKDPGVTPTDLPGWDELYSTVDWSDWHDLGDPQHPYTHDGVVHIDETGYDSTQWYNLSDGVTGGLPPDYETNTRTTDGSFTIDTPYAYYYIDVWFTTYSEESAYWWMYGGRPTDVFAAAFDNIGLRVSVATIYGDVNLDGLVNALDISGFISRLTTGTYQAEADINGDLAVNALDISGFVACLTGGACGHGETGSGVVPEPSSIAVCGLAVLAMVRRPVRV